MTNFRMNNRELAKMLKVGSVIFVINRLFPDEPSTIQLSKF